MDKEPKKLVSSRKIGKRLVRGTFAGRIVTASIPSSRLRSLKSQEDGYNADESDFEESQEESTIFYVPSLYMKRQSQSIKSLPKNLQSSMYRVSRRIETQDQVILGRIFQQIQIPFQPMTSNSKLEMSMYRISR